MSEADDLYALDGLAPAGAALFLDFDGTLVDIADTPDGIVVDPALPGLLDQLSQATGGRIALVSGRSVPDLAGFLPEFDGLLIGGHGAERRLDGRIERHPAATGPALPELIEAVEAFAKGRDGLIVERKPTGVVLHYRRAPDRGTEVERFVADLAQRYPDFEHHGAKMAAELRPDGIGKRAAIEGAMGQDGWAGRRPVFLGDDATDEPALAWVAGHGGVAVKVGEGESAAPHRLPDPASVRQLLARWIGQDERSGT